MTDEYPTVGLSVDGAVELAELVNRVYAVAEGDLWGEGKLRTSEEEIRRWIAGGEIAAATDGDRLLGCVRVREVEPGVAELGLLAVEPGQQGNGVGGALLDFAERHARERGAAAMRLQVLVPRDRSHPGKLQLESWYERRGYRPIGKRPFDDPLLVAPCDFVIYERPLSSTAHL